MVTTLIAAGLVLLVVFATLVGSSMDTERRRARWRYEAEQRRRRAERRWLAQPSEHVADPHRDRPVHPGRSSG